LRLIDAFLVNDLGWLSSEQKNTALLAKFGSSEAFLKLGLK
jgi:hypothetical protein